MSLEEQNQKLRTRITREKKGLKKNMAYMTWKVLQYRDLRRFAFSRAQRSKTTLCDGWGSNTCNPRARSSRRSPCHQVKDGSLQLWSDWVLRVHCGLYPARALKVRATSTAYNADAISPSTCKQREEQHLCNATMPKWRKICSTQPHLAPSGQATAWNRSA